MKIMNKLITIALLFLIASCSSVAQQTNKNKQTTKNRPNIVYILADDMGIGDVSGLNAKAKLKTPNIDALINKGMTFTDAHTASAVCTPTRYGLMTGRYPWRTKLKVKVLDGYGKPLIAQDVDTAPKVLQRNGYQTGMIGKWHLGWDWTMTTDASKLPMDKVNPFKYARESNVATFVDFTKPFKGGPIDCGFDYYFGINASLDFPPYTFSENNKVIQSPTDDFSKKKNKSLSKEENKQMTMRAGAKAPDFDPNEVLLTLTNKTVDYIKNVDKSKPFFAYVPLTSPHTPVLPRKEFVGTSESGCYGDFIQELDWSVGQIVETLKKQNLLENTIIIVTADNGASKVSFPTSFEEKFKHHPSDYLKGRKGSLDEGGHRVPFIVHWPAQIKKASINTTVINLTDLYATCAEIVGETKPNQGVDSYSILSLLKGNTNYDRDISIHSDAQGFFAVRKGDYKLRQHKIAKKYGLFNLKEDVSETNNLYANPNYKDIRKELETEMNKVVTQGRTTEGKPLPNDGNLVWKDFKWVENK